MSTQGIDYLIVGPLPPFRGGIAETQWEFANALHQKGYTIECWNFNRLYPAFLFPGKSQFDAAVKPMSFVSKRNVHAYNPFSWLKLAQEIRKKKPKRVVFRYWSPFLAPLYGTLARLLPSSLPKIVLIDNWQPHEKSRFDSCLNAFFKKRITHFTTLSKHVAEQISVHKSQKVWWGFHPLPTTAPKKHTLEKAREILKMNKRKAHLLFFGLIRPYKGLDLLIEACSKIDVPIDLHIVGEFYTDKTPYLKRIKEYQLEEHIHLVDKFVSAEEVAQYFSAADVVVLPYKSATQSGVIAQAYQYETPILVTEQPGLAKAIRKDNTGRVCKTNAVDIAENIRLMLSNEAQNKCRIQLKNSKKNYQWSTFVDQWTRFVEKT